MSPPSPDQTQSIALPTVAPSGGRFDLVSGGVVDGRLDSRHTCFGAAVSPPVEFVNVSSDIVTLAVVMINETGVAHWAMANIEPANSIIAEGEVAPAAIRATVDDGVDGYRAPCPEADQTLALRLIGYALVQQVDLPDGVDANTLIELLEAAALDVAVLEINVPAS